MDHSNDVNISRSISDRRVTPSQGSDAILEKAAQAEPKRSPSGSEHEKFCTASVVGVH